MLRVYTSAEPYNAHNFKQRYFPAINFLLFNAIHETHYLKILT